MEILQVFKKCYTAIGNDFIEFVEDQQVNNNYVIELLEQYVEPNEVHAILEQLQSDRVSNQYLIRLVKEGRD